MAEPSVKGTLIQGVVGQLHDLLSAERITREQLARNLKPEDCEILDSEVVISAWYPVDAYGRMLEEVAHAIGRTDDEYYVESGRENARRLVELGVYRQLDERTAHWGDRVGRLLVSVAGAVWSFGHWEWLGLDGHHFHIAVSGVAAMPRVYALRTQGFVEYLASHAAGHPVPVVMQRSADGDRLEFRADA